MRKANSSVVGTSGGAAKTSTQLKQMVQNLLLIWLDKNINDDSA